MKRALILLASGCEEIEAVVTMDVLRRGGVEVVAAGLKEGPVVASREVKLLPDVALDDCKDAKDFDLLILPGGLPGTEALREDIRVRDLVIHYLTAPGKLVATICAAALVLEHHGLLEGRMFTCYPKFRADISGGNWLDQPVVVDEDLITSQGPGTAIAFALTLVERLVGRETRNDIAVAMLYPDDR